MIKFVHVRYRDPETKAIMSHGGVTFAYTHTDTDIFFQVAFCRVPGITEAGNLDPGDMFSRAMGRRIAANRLRTEGPFDVLVRTNTSKDAPSEYLMQWLGEYLAVTIETDEKNRYVIDYQDPSDEPS